MGSRLVLNVFQGVDLFGQAIREECPDWSMVWGPEAIWGDDIRGWHVPAGVWWGVIGSPPCQAFSRLRHLVRANGNREAENLIPEFERVVREGQPEWFLMENVPAAPEPCVPGYIVRSHVVNNRWTGAEQNRQRRFSLGTRDGRDFLPFLEVAALEACEWAPAVCASGGVKPGIPTDRNTRARFLGYKTATALAESIRLQELPADFLAGTPFTLEGKHMLVGNGVPRSLGRAIARAVRRALEATRG